MTLKEKILESELVNLPDWQVAELLNSSNNSLPIITDWEKTSIGFGLILLTLGLNDGVNFLDQLSNLSTNNSSIKWLLKIIELESLDLSNPVIREQIIGLAQSPINILTNEQLEKLLFISKKTRYPSWSEYYNVVVDARTVGLARGAI